MENNFETENEFSVEANEAEECFASEDNLLEAEQTKEEKEQLYNVTFDGKEQLLTMNELVENAQKGLGYDKISEDYEKLKSSPVLAAIEQMAKNNQMSAIDYVNVLLKREEEKKVVELMDKGVPQNEARRLCELEKMSKALEAKELEKKPFEEFVEKYPNVCGEEIDKSVWEEFAKTNDLVGAYARFENRQLKTKIEMMERNGANRQKSIGEAESAASAVHDSFLEGLYE